MLAKEKWQIRTIKVLEMVFAERVAQRAKHGEAMRALPDGTGPDQCWLLPLSDAPASAIQEDFRDDYMRHRGQESLGDGEYGELTKMHLVREELAEALELFGDDPEFIGEILQVAALCVQWAEIKLEEQEVL